MSDLFRDASARKSANKREKTRHEYTPIVLWVQTPENKRIHEVRNWMQDELSDLPYVEVATTHEPYQFATEGTIREEEADGGKEDDDG